MRRTHPLRQPLDDTSPNSMGEFAPLGENFVLICAAFSRIKASPVGEAVNRHVLVTVD